MKKIIEIVYLIRLKNWMIDFIFRFFVLYVKKNSITKL